MPVFRYLSIVIISSLIIMAAASKLVNIGVRRSSVDFFGKMNAAGNRSLKVDIILAGSSRVLVQVDPKIIDSITRLQSYNYGLNLIGIKSSYNLIHYALSAHPDARLVLLNIDYNMFDIEKDPYKDPFFYAYEKDFPGKFVMANPKLDFFHRLHIFDISMYDDMVKYAAIVGLASPHKALTGVYKGYFPDSSLNSFVVPPPSLMAHKTDASFTDQGMNILRQIITLCRQKQKKLVLVVAPYPKQYAPEKYIANYSVIINKVKMTADSNKVPFFDYSDNFIAGDSTCFYDILHLNIKGAEIYSRLLGNDIRKSMDTAR